MLHLLWRLGSGKSFFHQENDISDREKKDKIKESLASMLKAVSVLPRRRFRPPSVETFILNYLFFSFFFGLDAIPSVFFCPIKSSRAPPPGWGRSSAPGSGRGSGSAGPLVAPGRASGCAGPPPTGSPARPRAAGA